MSTDGVALIPECAECGASWLGHVVHDPTVAAAPIGRMLEVV